MREKIWDLGPKPPKAPEAPKAPAGKAGNPEHDLAMLHYEQELEAYKADLRAYGALKDEYQKWKEKVGGPVELDMWSVDAAQAMARDPDRYVKELPRGSKPGKAHFENLERAREREESAEDDRKRDPQFGAKATGAKE